MIRRTVNFSFLSLLLMICLVFNSGCSSDEKPPKDTLSQEQMASILTDIHIAESRVTRMQLKSSDSSLMVFNKLKQDIWKKYKVDTLNYRNSYTFYMTHPKQMSQIYEKVNKKIESREKSNNFKP
ncbi:DUF4296 domain-containing protein [Dyadobacter psychrotolerans]|uniref:DUF4296 domain-containing protein n=1 Tax=Dyadobacter psychrotolerans TaxID=2541721 RepID=A0A4R5DIY1_9BACT|nr:DUF4296 domain-containing protein [Dyadobacter psychrotolerans]TDE13909.1 DUF4296 domain-containing protein [Dyadobacter psychrotolerans]